MSIETHRLENVAVPTDSLLVYEKKNYLKVYLDNCHYEIIGKLMIDYLGENPF